MRHHQQFTARRSERGNTLFITMIGIGIIGLALAGYLKLVISQNYSVARSQSWNEGIAIAEAGVEEVLAQINSNTSPLSMLANGWTYTGSKYSRTRQLGDDSYTVEFALSGGTATIESTGRTPVPQSNSHIERRVRVVARLNSLFSKGMVAKGQINLNGNNIQTDSFDSSDPNYSTGGRYDPAKRKANGDVATNSGIIDSLSAGNADIRGKVSTGPGGSVAIGPSGSVGSDAWVSGGNNGIEPGYFTDDMNVDFPDVTPPFTVGLPPLPGTVGGVSYGAVLTSGDYYLSSLSLSGTGTGSRIIVTGDARLYVNGNISLTGGGKIEVASGGRLELYANGATTALGGNGVVNHSGSATNFFYFGTPNNTSLSMSGNGEFTGTIYAPSANFSLNGGGNTTTDFIGASVTKTVTMNGKFNFHYDEVLGKISTDGTYKISSWNEF